LTEYVRSRTDFKEAAEITLFVAKDLFGKGSREEKAVGEGWRKVGVLK
jgi:Zn-dependent metalloprotease